MKSLLLALSLVVAPLLSLAQSEVVCGTPPADSASFYSQPWIGNNQFLIDLLDSIEYGQAIPKTNGSIGGFDENTVYWIPVQAWVYNKNDGTDGIPPNEVEESIELLNRFFAGEQNNEGQVYIKYVAGDVLNFLQVMSIIHKGR
jgi:hypothetical protein